MFSTERHAFSKPVDGTPNLMHLLPLALRFALLCSLALVVTRSSVHGDCAGDYYWDAEPEGTLTWYPRGSEIPLRLSLQKALDVVRHALQAEGLPPCDTEKDLTNQKLKIVAAFRTDAVNTRIPDGFDPAIQDHSQVMMRVVDRGAEGYGVQILTRTKWAYVGSRPEKADKEERCAALKLANKVRARVTTLAK